MTEPLPDSGTYHPEKKETRPTLDPEVSALIAEIFSTPLDMGQFDVQSYDRLEQAECRELTIADCDQVGCLYKAAELDSRVLPEMYSDSAAAAHAINLGCMMHPWEPSTAESNWLKQHWRAYKSPKEEFHECLEGRHGRAAVFKAFGLFDHKNSELLAVSSVFLPPPPDDASVRNQHGIDVIEFFTDRIQFSPHPHFNYRKLCQTARTTAEWHLILGKHSLMGAGTTVFHAMVEGIQAMIKRGETAVTDMYLLRLGSIRMVHPRFDEKITHDDPNLGSERFTRRRAFRNCGYRTNPDERVCREVCYDAGEAKTNMIYAAQPAWIAMHAKWEDIVKADRIEIENVRNRAASARRARR